MKNALSQITIAEYLPALRRIFAAIDVGFSEDPNPNKPNDLHLLFLEKELPGSTYVHAMDIIATWLKDSKFGSDFARIWKRDTKVDWRELMDVLRQKMTEYASDITVIEMTLQPNGRMTRTINGNNLVCDFKDDGLKVEIIRMLVDRGGYVPTKEIREKIGCKNLKALSDHKRKINAAIRTDLKLPSKINVIDSKPRLGYRIHPFYNIVDLK